MRIAAGLLASAAVLFSFGAANLIGTWSLAAAVVLAVAAAVDAVIVMESREHLGDSSAREAALVTHLELP